MAAQPRGLRLARRQHGYFMIMMALSMTTVIAAAALGVDYAALAIWRTELQSGADAAALAAVSALPDGDFAGEAIRYGAKNRVAGAGLQIAAADVEGGIYDFDTGVFTPAAVGAGLNAVRVTARRDQGSPDGPLQTFFGEILGQGEVSMTAESKAVIDQRLGGIRSGTASPLVPFLVDAETFGGIHDGKIDPPIGDEVSFFPGGTTVAGNFGLADIDGGDNGVPELRDWIENGYPENISIPEDTGYLNVLGSTGIDTGIKSSVEARIGDTIAVMAYDQASGTGSNAEFRVRTFVAVEITAVDLTGNQDDRHITGVVREMPAAWAITSTWGMTNGSVSRARLVP